MPTKIWEFFWKSSRPTQHSPAKWLPWTHYRLEGWDAPNAPTECEPKGRIMQWHKVDLWQYPWQQADPVQDCWIWKGGPHSTHNLHSEARGLPIWMAKETVSCKNCLRHYNQQVSGAVFEECWSLAQGSGVRPRSAVRGMFEGERSKPTEVCHQEGFRGRNWWSIESQEHCVQGDTVEIDISSQAL